MSQQYPECEEEAEYWNQVEAEGEQQAQWEQEQNALAEQEIEEERKSLEQNGTSEKRADVLEME
jgi:hypothetical protein